jgi:hypothetical protein
MITPIRRSFLQRSGLLLVSVIFPALMFIQPSQAQPAALTVRDYIDIQQLVNRLNFALDYCTNGGRDFADLFIDGGEYIIDTGNGNPGVRNTYDALVALAGGPDCDSRRTPPSSYILHLSESLVIEPAAGGASGMSYAIYPANHGQFLNAETAGQLGIYHDSYVKTPAGWRLKSRRHETNPEAGKVDL